VLHRETRYQRDKERHSPCKVLCVVWWCIALGLLCVQVRHAGADWKLKRTDRWEKIAQRLELMLIEKPAEGYALKRLLRHYRKKDLGRLRKRLRVLQKRKGYRDRGTFALALVDLYTGAFTRAIQGFELLRQSKVWRGSRDKLLLALGKAYMRNNQQAKAEKALAEAIKGMPKGRGKRLILRTLAQLSETMKRWQKAQTYYRAILAKKPSDVDAHLGLIRCLEQLKQPAAVIEQLKRMIPHTSKTRRPVHLKKLLQYQLQQKDYKDALSTLTRIRKQLSNAHWMQRELIEYELQLHTRQKTLPTLLAQIKQRAKTLPRQYLPYVGRVQQTLGLWTEALKTYKQLLKRYPKHPAFLKMIDLLLKRKRFPQALALLKEQQKRQPDEVTIPLRILTVLQETQAHIKRDQFIYELLQTQKTNKLLQYRMLELVKAWELPVNVQLALFQAYCSQKPMRASCFRQWGAYLWKKKRRQRAWEIWDKIREIKPTQASSLFDLAEIYYKHGRYQKSIPLLQQLLKGTPFHQKARLLLANIWLQKAKKPARALTLYRKLLSSTSNTGLQRKARRGIIQTTLKLYGYSSAFLLFQRDYFLHPFQKQPRQLLMAFYLRNSQRKASQRLLKESLSLFPDDVDFRRIALDVYKSQSHSLPHLRWLLLRGNPPSGTLDQYVALSHKYKRQKQLLKTLQDLTKQWPKDADYWEMLGKEASQQKRLKLAERAFQRAHNIKPNNLTIRMGYAALLARQKEYSRAYKLLRIPTPPKNTMQLTLWLARALSYAIKDKQDSKQLLQTLSRPFQTPGLFSLHMLESLKSLRKTLSAKRRHSIKKQLTQQGLPHWRKLALHHKHKDVRKQALFALWRAKKTTNTLLTRALQDKDPLVRSYAVILFAMISQPENYLRFEQLERYDRSYLVRAAASLAVSRLAGTHEVGPFYRAIQFPQLWELISLLMKEKPHLNHIRILSLMYNRSTTPQQDEEVLETFLAFSPKQIETLDRMLSRYSTRCFAFRVLTYLRTQKKNVELSSAAHRISFNEGFLRRLCQKRKKWRWRRGRRMRRHLRRRRFRRILRRRKRP